MRITIELPPDVQAALPADAERLHLPLAEYALRVLSIQRPVTSVPRNGAELVDYWKTGGLVGTRLDVADTQLHARQIRSEATRRTVSNRPGL